MSGSRLRVLASCTFCGHIYRQTGKPAVWLCTLQLWQAKGNGHSIHCFPARVKIMAGEGRKIELESEGGTYGGENFGARFRAQGRKLG